MKKVALLSLILVLAMSLTAMAQEAKKLPVCKVKSTKGKIVSTADFQNEGKPMVVSFWATWCKPCLEELTTVNELLPSWTKETGVKMIAVSIDDSRTSKKVAPYVKSAGWEAEVYLDENSDFKRAMGVTNPPHTFLINGKGEIVWEHSGYAPGDEKKLYEKIKELSNEQKTEQK